MVRYWGGIYNKIKHRTVCGNIGYFCTMYMPFVYLLTHSTGLRNFVWTGIKRIQLQKCDDSGFEVFEISVAFSRCMVHAFNSWNACEKKTIPTSEAGSVKSVLVINNKSIFRAKKNFDANSSHYAFNNPIQRRWLENNHCKKMFYFVEINFSHWLEKKRKFPKYSRRTKRTAEKDWKTDQMIENENKNKIRFIWVLNRWKWYLKQNRSHWQSENYKQTNA